MSSKTLFHHDVIRFYNLPECFDRLHLEIVIRFYNLPVFLKRLLGVSLFHHGIVMPRKRFEEVDKNFRYNYLLSLDDLQSHVV